MGSLEGSKRQEQGMLQGSQPRRLQGGWRGCGDSLAGFDEAVIDRFHITTDDIWCTASDDAHSFFAVISDEGDNEQSAN